MTVRSIAAVAAVAVGFATPVIAEDGRTSDVPAFRSARAAGVVYEQKHTYSKAPRSAYVSDNSVPTTENHAVAPVQATRTINVWGSRFEVPAY